MKNILVILLSLYLTGCITASKYDIRVNSFLDPDVKIDNKSFSIQSNEKVASPLEFKEYSNVLRKALEQKGYVFSADAKKSDILIFLSYSVDNGQTSTNVSMLPVYGQSYNSTVQNSYGQNLGSITTSPQNPYSPVAYQPIYSSETNYTRTIFLGAVDNIARKDTPMWETTIISVGDSDDLRKVFPVMILGAIKHIGTNTDGFKKADLYIYREDSRLKALKSNSEQNRRPSSVYLKD